LKLFDAVNVKGLKLGWVCGPHLKNVSVSHIHLCGW